MPWQRFDRRTLPATPWKNGGGVTREIVCQPPGAGLETFDWRVSIATIASDGPFSTFAGIDRIITLLEGGGVHLASDDGAIDHRLDSPLHPFAFPGEACLHARVLAGDCEDFNVMTRRSVCRARVQRLREASELSAPAGLMLATRGRWQAQAAGHEAEALSPQQGLWWHQPNAFDSGPSAAPPVLWHVRPASPDADLLAVTIHPVPVRPS